MSFFFRFGRIALSVGSIALGAVGARAAEVAPAKPFVPEFEFAAPLGVVTSAATKNGVILEGIDRAVELGSGLKSGDQITALVSLVKDKALTQWLVEASCDELNATERAKPPLRTATLYTNTGTEVFFGGTRCALVVRVIGPFERTSGGREENKNSTEQRARVLVNADYLGLGLNRACEAVFAVNAAKQKDPGLAPFPWTLRPKPFPAEEAAAGRKLALALGLTPERERAQAGAVPALLEFFHIISRTPGLQDILKGVMDVPWWTVIKRGGDVPIGLMPQFRYTEEVPAGSSLVPGEAGQAYTVPFVLSIGGKPALVGKLAVIDPRRPLLACAGILGVAACAPDGKGPRVMLQVVSARLGADK
jgi:hypothetical protein